ncbi:hypothetical protein DBR45_52185 [Pseudomonas sp. HMWF031]|nr:hypothetical protein DBR45_52185 [Pseudomonas sp. HMWF031]
MSENGWLESVTQILWRGSLLPLGCEAAPLGFFSPTECSGFATASQPSGSKLPRHKSNEYP